jgi:uncharacterized protein GlcG (DUF336 family)
MTVADAGGNLLAFARVQKAWLGSIVMIFAGALPLKSGNEVVGAVGVSGGSGDQDQKIAETAAAAL